MWDLPGPGLEPVSPALAGGFLTTVPPGKPLTAYFYINGWYLLLADDLFCKSFMVSFTTRMFFILTYSNLSIFFFMVYAFLSSLRYLSFPQCHEDILPSFSWKFYNFIIFKCTHFSALRTQFSIHSSILIWLNRYSVFALLWLHILNKWIKYLFRSIPYKFFLQNFFNLDFMIAFVFSVVWLSMYLSLIHTLNQLSKSTLNTFRHIRY